MQLILICLLAVSAVFLAATVALYSYGRFARRVRGVPSGYLPVSGEATALDRLVAPLLKERPGQSGLILVASNLDAFAVRALTARHAERSLDIQSYIWHRDLTGRLLAGEIIQAADRGVRVRLLLDDINAQGRDRIHLAIDAHPNISVRLFNPSRSREGTFARGLGLLLRSVRITRRMHNKAWIADGRLAVVGGRNIGDAYFDAAPTTNFRDLDLLMLGTAVRQAEVVFDDFWNSAFAVPIGAFGKARKADLPALRRTLSGLLHREHTGPYLSRVAEEESIHARLSAPGHIHWAADARVVSDPPEKARGTGQERWLMNIIQPVMASAQSDMQIISPYFIPGEMGTGELIASAGRGVAIAILTNSLAATDVTAVHGAYARYRRLLIEGGIELFELKPYDERSRVSLFGSRGASLHTKAFMVDRRLGFIGSMNFDPRSRSLNAEMGVLFEHPGLVAELCQIFADQTAAANSYRVRVEDGRIAWRDFSAGAVRICRSEPEAGIWRRLAAKAIGLLPIESQL